MLPVAVLLLLSPLPFISAALLPKWHRFAEHTEKPSGGDEAPAIRYSHGAVTVGGEMIISHGYYYCRETNGPSWLHDTWAFDLSGNNGWRRIATGIDMHSARTGYDGGGTPDAPSGRYGVSLEHYEGSLYMFGGTDGGSSKHKKNGYEAGYEINELWKLELATGKWELVTPGPGSYKPVGRHLHNSAVVGGVMYVFGGNTEGSGDVVGFDFRTRTWSVAAAEAAEGPGPLFGHVSMELTTDSFRGFLVYGGRRRNDSMKKVSGDVWLFDTDKAAWRGPVQLAAPASAPALLPAPRVYSALAAIEAPAAASAGWAAAGVLTMGSVTTPLMSCNNEAWALTVAANASVVGFSRLPDIPTGHYHHSLVSHGAKVAAFGGHLCSTTKQETDHPFYYLNWVEGIDLSSGWAAEPVSAFVPAWLPAPKGKDEL